MAKTRKAGRAMSLKRARSYVRRPRVKKTVIKPIKTYVKRAINNAIETKTVTKIGVRSLYAYTGTSWSTENRLCMTPMNNAGAGVILASGDAQDQGTGNYVKSHKVIFKGVIYPNPYNAVTNPNPCPQEIVFWFVSFRPQPAITTNPVDGTYFQEGGSSAAPQGTLIDVIRTVNPERFKIYGKRVIKLGNSAINGTGGTAGTQQFANNDFNLNHKFYFDVTKMVPKKVIFNDAINNDPTSRALWCVWEAVNADGTTQAVNTIPLSMQYQIDFNYKDA